MTENMITIDKERFNFLFYAFFGPSKEPFPTVSMRAYRDLCRTIPLNGKIGSECRMQVDSLIENRVVELLDSGINSHLGYDDWHYDTSIEMIDIYKAEDITFTFGQAQKWINMTMKYLYRHGAWDLSEIFPFLHVPIDSYILTAAENQLHIQRPCSTWSKLDDYSFYLGYQNALRERLHQQSQTVDPLRWEFGSWLGEIKVRSLQ